MIKELLIFLILLRQFNAKNSSDYLAVEKCLKEEGEKLSHGMVCIPREYWEHIQFSPANTVTKGRKTKLWITMSTL